MNDRLPSQEVKQRDLTTEMLTELLEADPEILSQELPDIIARSLNSKRN
jgi:hypothetical protein